MAENTESTTVVASTSSSEDSGEGHQQTQTQPPQQVQQQQPHQEKPAAQQQQQAQAQAQAPQSSVTKAGLMDETWIVLQTKAFLAWANSHLMKRELQAKTLNDLAGDGLMLIALIETLTGKKFDLRYEKKPKSRIQYLINANAAFEFLESQGVKLISFSAETYVDGNTKLTLALLWALIRKYQIGVGFGGEGGEDGGDHNKPGSSMKNALLQWVQEVTKDYNGVDVKDFTKSFQDGLAFCALLHYTDHDLIDYDSLDEEATLQNLNTCFDTAAEALQIPKLLAAEDVNQGLIDEHVVMTYVSYFRNAAALEEKQRALKKTLKEEKGHSEELQAQLQKALEETENLHQRLDQLALQNADLEKRLQEEKDAHNATREQLAVTESARNGLADKLVEVTDEAQRANDAHRKAIADLEKQLAQVNHEKDALRERGEALDKEKQQLKELMNQSSDDQGKSLAAMTEKAAEMERNYMEMKGKYEDAKAEMDLMKSILDDFKKTVENKLLVFPLSAAEKTKEADAKLRLRLQEVKDTLKREEDRIPLLEKSVKETSDQITQYQAQLDQQKGKKDKKIVDKLQEAEILNHQDSAELILYKNLRSILHGEKWTTETQIIRSDKREAFDLGEDINQRMDVVAAQFKQSMVVVEELRACNRDLQVDYNKKSHQVDDVFSLMKGDLLLKYNTRATGKPHKRFFFMHLFREPVIFWSDSDTISGQATSGAFAFFKSDDFKQAVIQDVVTGPSEDVLKTHELTPEIQALSFSINTSDRRLDLIAPTQEIYKLWTDGLGKVLEDYQKGFIGLGTGSRLRVEVVLQKSLGVSFNVEEQRKKLEAEQKKQEEDTKRALNDMKYAIARKTMKVDDKTASALKATETKSSSSSNLSQQQQQSKAADDD